MYIDSYNSVNEEIYDSYEFFVGDGLGQNGFRRRVLALASNAAKRIGLQTKAWRGLPSVQA